MAQAPTITLLEPTVKVVLVDGITIPVDNIAWAGPVNLDPNNRGISYAEPREGTIPAYRVRFRSEGFVDLFNITADAFASALAGAAF